MWGKSEFKYYSQAGQDLFVWEVSGNKQDGTFIDIGCNDPVIHNNTLGLELQGWNGVSVDIEKFDYSKRKCQFVQADARKIIPAVEHFVKQRNGIIDYLSMDADDATWDALTRLIPFHKFRAITVEHDKYRVGPEIQARIHDFLKTFGYLRKHIDVCAPIAPGQPWSGQPFEDWYILP
jgi:hypothetical protein